MSFDTWKEEFYPVDVDSLPKKISDEDLILHSLKKWEGLRSSEIEKHEVKIISTHWYNAVVGSGIGNLKIDSSSCSLCSVFAEDCEECPLSKPRGGVSCDKCMTEEEQSPWRTFCDTRNPEPMIKALEDALEYERT